MLRLAIAYFDLHFSLQNQECVHLARVHVERIRYRESPPRNKLFNPRKALPRNERSGAFLRPRPLPPPHHDGIPALFLGDETTPPLRFQAVLPAFVAIPSGPVRKLKVERDDQFFISASVRPHSARIAASASMNRSSGPRSISVSTSAAAPSISSPRTSSSPHRTYSV